MTRMHAGEHEVDEALVRRLLTEQFPQWPDRPLRRVEHPGTENAVFWLGDELALRLVRTAGHRGVRVASSSGFTMQGGSLTPQQQAALLKSPAASAHGVSN
jgi:aminoglycoside phosphotransferase (APT) family kinase protein